ncbi:rhomboid-domain-containing protein [Xylariaceae sp. AK1471]|nr:rhomboid-domain-containing protein [Xylariaceae sp. AK1471]
MPILPISTPSSSFQIGLRAVIRASEKRVASVAVIISITRTFSTSPSFSSPPQSCFQYSIRGIARPSIALYNVRSRNRIPQVHLRTIFTFRAITHYTNLPDWYEDAEGLPFRREELNQREANQIFPSNLAAPQANLLLKILHGRRVAGTLDDPTLVRNTRQFRVTDQKRALEYLREHIPVDEVLNAGLRAEDELSLIEEEENAGREAEERLGETRSQGSQGPPLNTPEETSKASTGRLPRKRGSDSPYGESNFDRIRAENIAKREAEEARLEEEQKRKEEELAKGNIGTLQTQQEKPRELSPFRKKHLERATSDLEAPPEMKAWERLLPSIVMATLVVLGSMGFATLYQAPPASRRLWPDIPPAAATCLALIGANLAIWALWKFPPAWAVLNRYMILIAATPRPLQVLGAMFSHQSFGHLAANMTFLWFFGTRIHDEIGRGNFLALYFSSGAVGFAASLAHLVLWRGLNCTTLGASGAVYGLITAFFWMHKFDEFKVFGYPPDPISGPQGLGFLGLIVGIHLVPLLLKRVHNIDIASHFGGMLAGVVGIDLARKHMDYKARIRTERLKSMGVVDTVVQTKQISPPVVEAPSPLPAKR